MNVNTLAINSVHALDAKQCNKESALKVNKLSFFGVELDVITGHPDFELLFVASQVAAAAGLDGYAVTNAVKRNRVTGVRVKEAGPLPVNMTDSLGRKLKTTSWLFDESTVYLMLLRGKAPQSEPFRRWVTEEVLPSIRKSGTYDIAKSHTPEGLQFSDELGALRAALQATTARLESLEATISLLPQQIQEAIATTGGPVSNEPSPYDGQHKRAVWQMWDRKSYLEAGEVMGLSMMLVDKLSRRAMIKAEHEVRTLWHKTDGRTLNASVSKQGRDWVLFPEDWLKAALSREFYRIIISSTLDESTNVN